jgi:hypothetical protein
MTILTNEEHMQVDRLYWDGLAMAQLYRVSVCLADKIRSNEAWIARTQIRMTGAVADLNATDPKDARKYKDAQTEVDNCTKLLTRLTAENEELTLKKTSADAQHGVIYARVLAYPFGGKIHRACEARYPRTRPCC